MSTYVGLLRAINVGGTGKLAMSELRALCEKVGFTDVATYIQSGNVVFKSKLSESGAKKALEKALAQKMGKPFGAMIRTSAELEAILKRNPFKNAPTNRVIVLFLDEAPSAADMKAIKTPGREEWKLVGRELVIHYPDGSGASKLKIPFAKIGTGRNLNTVAKMAEMAREI